MKLFQIPINILLVGPSMSGKSTFVIKLLKEVNELFEGKIKEILYCTSHGHKIHNSLPSYVKQYKGIPSSSYFNDREPRLLILDDMLYEISKDMVEIFTKHAHHLNFGTIFISQSMFSPVKSYRDITLNCQVIIVFKNPRDTQQIKYLSRQIYSKNPKLVQEAYEDACTHSYGYLVCDLRQTTQDHLRFLTNIFVKDKPRYIYYVPNEVDLSSIA